MPPVGDMTLHRTVASNAVLTGLQQWPTPAAASVSPASCKSRAFLGPYGCCGIRDEPVASRILRPTPQALLEDSRVGQGVFRLAGLDPPKVEEAIKVRQGSSPLCTCTALSL